jgi:hypothetical protein
MDMTVCLDREKTQFDIIFFAVILRGMKNGVVLNRQRDEMCTPDLRTNNLVIGFGTPAGKKDFTQLPTQQVRDRSLRLLPPRAALIVQGNEWEKDSPASWSGRAEWLLVRQGPALS